MAHDLKNPLAALQGAAQFLDVELLEPRTGVKPRAFVKLMLEQVQRLEKIVERYRRLAQVQPLRARTSLNQLVGEVMALQTFGAGERISITQELAADLPDCDLDRDLIASALENLVRNAIEAMPEGGSICVRTESRFGAVVLSVEDTGPGMDARTRERAFDDFFTTKAAGSGLGLAFVRRVAEAHGGSASLGSRAGRGTIVSVRLPAPGGEAWPTQPS
jgi:signal transduction histidine kinase